MAISILFIFDRTVQQKYVPFPNLKKNLRRFKKGTAEIQREQSPHFYKKGESKHAS
jgi:hypothetical protein